MDRDEATIIMELLEAATDFNWPATVAYMEYRGHFPERISAAWKKLEKLAGMSGCAPEPSDF